jgi:hypothetical protein
MIPKTGVAAIIARVMTLLATTVLAAPAVPPKSHTLDELWAVVAYIMNKNHIAGVGIAVVSKDRITWAGGVGKAKSNDWQGR